MGNIAAGNIVIIYVFGKSKLMMFLSNQVPVLLLLTSLGIFILRRFRFVIVSLAIQYLIVFLLVLSIWTPGLSAVKLVTGWMVCAILAATQIKDSQYQDNFTTLSARIFKVIFAMFFFLAAGFLSPELSDWLFVSENLLESGLLLIGMGILQLGLTSIPARVIIGLLIVFSGFEIIYAGIESSVLVTGLLAFMNLALALVGAYILTLEQDENL